VATTADAAMGSSMRARLRASSERAQGGNNWGPV
jgi:hypothetical protein